MLHRRLSSVCPSSTDSTTPISSVCSDSPENKANARTKLTKSFTLDATYQIAIWSNVEAGLGITAGSLATLRPLLRMWTGSHSDPYYNNNSGFPSAFPGGRSRSASRQLGGCDNRPFPLGSLDDSGHRLRPDKLAVTVTTIHSQRDPNDLYSTSPTSSEERLTSDRSSPRDIGLGIHRTFEVTQTSTERIDSERIAVREHV